MLFSCQIKSIKMINSWCHVTKNIDCTICRKNINANSIYTKDTNSKIIEGKCGHSFHSECIIPWITVHPTCPICSQNWIK